MKVKDLQYIRDGYDKSTIVLYCRNEKLKSVAETIIMPL